MAPTIAGPPDWDSIPEPMRKEMNISKEDFEQIRKDMSEREQRTPAAGTAAPDFELRRLDANGALSEETLRLSALRGRPVALLFGSYT
jgi:hypothetical protein